MNKNDYIRELRNGLSELPFFQQEEIIKDYLTYFDRELAAGVLEKDIIKELGPTEVIAQLFYDELVDKKDLKPQIRIIKRNIGLFISVIIFDVLIGVWLILALIALALALFILGIITFFFLIALMLKQGHLSILEILASLFIILGTSLISISLGYILFSVIKKGIVYHLNWLKKLIKGGYHEVD